MTRLLLLTAIWKRPALSRLVLRAYQRTQKALEGEVDLRLLAVGSEKAQSRSLCQDSGFDYVEHPNEPLSYKWNAGIQAAAEYDPDGVVIMGSDGILSTESFTVYEKKLEEGHDFFGFRDMYFFDPTTPRLGYWGGYEHSPQKNRTGEPIGSGRCFSRRLLDRMRWNLWPKEPKVNATLDYLSLNYVKVHGFRPTVWSMDEFGTGALEIKAGLNLTPFDAIEYQDIWVGEQALERARAWLREEELTALLDLSAAGTSDGTDESNS